MTENALIPENEAPEAIPAQELSPAPAPAKAPEEPIIGPILQRALKGADAPVAAKKAPTTKDGSPVVGPVLQKALAQREEQSSGGEILARSAVSSATRSAGLLPGALMGARAGMMAPPNLWPVTVPAGAFAGLATAYWAGDIAAKELERREIGLDAQDPSVPESLRPWAVSGNVFGGGLSMSGSTMLAAQSPARLAPTMVGNVINRVLDTAANRPFWFAHVEGTATTSAAIAEGAYEALRPGHPWERTGVGIAAGVANPVRWASEGLTTRLYQGARALYRLAPWTDAAKARNLSRSGQELARLLQASGDDPKALVAMLDQSNEKLLAIPEVGGTAAMRTGSPRLAQLEADLMEMDRQFFGARAEEGNRVMNALGKAVAMLRGDGRPEALQAAAELRNARYEANFTRLLAYAHKSAVDAADDIAKGARPGDKAALSHRVGDIYESAIQRGREVEAELWERALGDGSKPGSFNNLLKMHSRLRGEMLQSQTLPDVIESEIKNISSARELLAEVAAGKAKDVAPEALEKAQQITSVSYMMKLRKQLLALARGAARSTTEMSDTHARQYGLMAEAVLEDMVMAGASTKATEAGLRGAGGRFVPKDTVTPYDDAREFTRAFHETFTRSFVGEARRQGAHGYQLPPEVMLKRALATGDEVGALRFRELEEAARFMPPRPAALGEEKAAQLLHDANVRTQDMLDAQGKFLRLAADQARDPLTGAVRKDRLADFMRNSQELLDRFPEVRADLENALKSQVRFEEWTGRITGLRKDLAGPRSVIAKLMSVDSPVDAVRAALSSSQPVTVLDEMVSLARGRGDDAVRGLRAAVWDAVLASAERNAPRKGAEYLDHVLASVQKPLRPGLPPLAQWMKSSGLLGQADVQLLDSIVEAADNARMALSTQATGEMVIKPANMLTKLLIRATGSGLSRFALEKVHSIFNLPKASAGQSLIVAGGGASAAEELLNRIPRVHVRQWLVDAFSGAPIRPGAPAFSLLREMLEVSSKPGVDAQRLLKLHAYAWQSGLLAAEDEAYAISQRPAGAVSGDAEMAPALEGSAADAGVAAESAPVGPQSPSFFQRVKKTLGLRP